MCHRSVAFAGVSLLALGAVGSASARTAPPLLDEWGAPGTAPGQLDAPLRFDAPDPWSGEHVGWTLVVDGPAGARRVQRFTTDGVFDRVYEGVFVEPVAAAFVEGEWAQLPPGRIAVLDAGADEVRVIDASTGALVDQWAVPPIDDGDLDFDVGSGTLWVCLTEQHAVQQYSFEGDLLRTIGTLGIPGDGAQRFDSPRSVEAQGQVVVADTGNDRVVLFWWDSAQQLWWASGGATGSAPGQFRTPWAATADCRNRVLVADRGNARVQRMQLADADPDPSVFAPALVVDEVWFDDGTAFEDLVDLLDPAGEATIVGLPRGRGTGTALNGDGEGLFALDRLRARVAHHEYGCCPGFPFSSVSSNGGDLLVTPAGGGPTLASIGGTVTVTITDPCGDPIPGVPRQDVWLDDAGTATLATCVNGALPDADSDAQGQMFFTSALAAGGTATSGLRVLVSGAPLDPTLPFRVVSPDFDGDLDVDLADVGVLARIHGGGYELRADLNFDGVISLPDIGEFAAHLGESCP